MVLCGSCVALAAFAASVAYADVWPPWTGISRGGGMSVPGGGVSAGIVVPNRQALARFPVLMLHPGHPPCSCDWYETFDWSRDAVVLVVAQTHSDFEIYRLARQGSVLRITIGPSSPGQPAVPSPVTLWLAVDVPKRLLGSPLPRRVVVAEVSTSR
jgi:hypothetical protein